MEYTAAICSMSGPIGLVADITGGTMKFVSVMAKFVDLMNKLDNVDSHVTVRSFLALKNRDQRPTPFEILKLVP